MPQFLKLEKKIAAGADFIIPQLGYDMRKFHEIRRYLRARNLDVPLLGNVYVLTRGAARAMNAGQVPGCEVLGPPARGSWRRSSRPRTRGWPDAWSARPRWWRSSRGWAGTGSTWAGSDSSLNTWPASWNWPSPMPPDWASLVRDLRFGRPGEFYLFPKPASYAPDAPPDPDPLPALKGNGAGPDLRGVAGHAPGALRRAQSGLPRCCAATTAGWTKGASCTGSRTGAS